MKSNCQLSIVNYQLKKMKVLNKLFLFSIAAFCFSCSEEESIPTLGPIEIIIQ